MTPALAVPTGTSALPPTARSERSVSKTYVWRQPEEGGFSWAATSALDKRVCPRYSAAQVDSLCHVPDRMADHSCTSNDDCGIDAGAESRPTRVSRYHHSLGLGVTRNPSPYLI